jgi:hypothetical protein
MPAPIYDIDPKKTYKIPSRSCYACDKGAIGVATHNGEIKAGCKRHANPGIKAKFACQYCGEFVRSGSLDFGMGPWDVAHRKCYAQANSDI